MKQLLVRCSSVNFPIKLIKEKRVVHQGDKVTAQRPHWLKITKGEI